CSGTFVPALVRSSQLTTLVPAPLSITLDTVMVPGALVVAASTITCFATTPLEKTISEPSLVMKRFCVFAGGIPRDQLVGASHFPEIGLVQILTWPSALNADNCATASAARPASNRMGHVLIVTLLSRFQFALELVCPL